MESLPVGSKKESQKSRKLRQCTTTTGMARSSPVIVALSLLAVATAQVALQAFSAGTISVLRVGSGAAAINPLQHQQVDLLEIQ